MVSATTTFTAEMEAKRRIASNGGHNVKPFTLADVKPLRKSTNEMTKDITAGRYFEMFWIFPTRLAGKIKVGTF